MSHKYKIAICIVLSLSGFLLDEIPSSTTDDYYKWSGFLLDKITSSTTDGYYKWEKESTTTDGYDKWEKEPTTTDINKWEDFTPPSEDQRMSFNFLDEGDRFNALENLIQEKDTQIRQNSEEIAELKKQIIDLYYYIASFSQKNQQNLDQKNEKVTEQIAVNSLTQLKTLRINQNTSEITEIKKRITTSNLAQAKSQQIGCTPFKDSPGVHYIQIPGSNPSAVLCDNDWIVIQRRFDGSVNFKRSWHEYSQGFGDLQGELFLGLDKIHRLTNSAQHELQIELIDFNNEKRYALYNNFSIDSERKFFRLNTLGSYSGNAGEAMSYHLGNAFTTYDRDNDGWGSGNCANYYEGAWWYGYDANCNLNGKYFQSRSRDWKSVWWYEWKGYHSLKSVKMMIRPKDN